MNYPLEFKKFISSQHFYSGLRITLGVMIPAIILFQYGVLGLMVNIVIGALFTGLSDPPGPPLHRRNGLIASITLNVSMALLAGVSNPFPALLGIEIAVLGFILSMLSIFGSRAGSIGSNSLIVFLLHIMEPNTSLSIPLQAALILAGGLWYALFSTVFYNIRPYKPIQQLLGDCLIQTADYMKTRAGFYDPRANVSELFSQLMEKQVVIHENQELLREMLFSTRKVVTESTRKGRNLVMIFIDSVDLLERIMTSQQNYTQIQQAFQDEPILKTIADNIHSLSNSIFQLGIAVQSGEPAIDLSLEEKFDQTWKQFQQLRKEKLNASNVEDFIMLRHIMYSLEDLTQRIKRMQQYSYFDKDFTSTAISDLDLKKFKSTPRIEKSLLISNLSLSSNSFKHSIRVVTALIIGYIVSIVLNIPTGYWILLTIVTIIKPAYSLSKKRNIQRLVGTFIGGAIAFGIFYLQPTDSFMFAGMLLMMILAYSFLQLNYGLAIVFLTAFLLLGLRFMDPRSTQDLLVDRIIDTAIGSAIAYIVSIVVLPSWESDKMDELIKKAVETNHIYFNTVSKAFLGKPATVEEYKIARKDAFVALANLSDNFQRMLSDPRSQRADQRLYHQFVSISHMLTSQVAALSAFAQKFASKYAGEGFEPMIKAINKAFIAETVPDNETINLHGSVLFKTIDKLLEQRRTELSGRAEEGSNAAPLTNTETRFTLSELKTITDQFRLIAGTIMDGKRVLKKLRGKPE